MLDYAQAIFPTSIIFPLSMRSTFYPLLKEKIHGAFGHAVDILTVVATLFGLSTSLGLGTMQISAGMQSAMNFPDSVVQRGIILLLVTVPADDIGDHDSERRQVSEQRKSFDCLRNPLLCSFQITRHIADSFLANTWSYLLILKQRCLEREVGVLRIPGGWLVGRLSIGRGGLHGVHSLVYLAKISWTHHRNFFCSIFLPTVVSLIYFTIFGNTAILLDANQASKLYTHASSEVSSTIYHFFSALPHSRLLSMLVILNLILFFVTSSDSASNVVDQLTSKTESRSVSLKIFWAMFEGLLSGSFANLRWPRGAAEGDDICFCANTDHDDHRII